MGMGLRSLLLASLLACVVEQSFSQMSPVRFEGGLSLGNELYSATGIAGRRPGSTYRAIFTPTITFFDQISLPFEFYVTNNDRGFHQPFNQFGVNPRLWGWLTLHAGYYSARVSELTFGDERLLGGGVELTPGLFRFSFLYGRSQKAVQTDTTTGVRGEFARRVYALKIGYGRPNDFFVDLNFMHAADDSGSMRNPVRGVSSDSILSLYDIAPRENAVLSLSYGVPIVGHVLHLQGETALSALSNDTRAPALVNPPFSLGSFFKPRTSSQLDGASVLSLNVVPAQNFSVLLSGRWVGPGFTSLGYAQIASDVMQFTVAPAFHLTDGSFMIRPSLGMQYNNLRNDHLSTTRRTIINVTSTVQPSQAFGIDVQYSNYGMRSNPRNDTLRIDNISQMAMFSPRYNFPSWDGTSSLVGSVTVQNFTDYNVATANLSENRMLGGAASWSLVFPSTLLISTSLNYTRSTTSLISTIVRSINETVGHSFFDGHLSANATIGYNAVSIGGTDRQITGRLSASYNTVHWGVFTLALSSNSYDYGNPGAGNAYTERQESLQYNIRF